MADGKAEPARDSAKGIPPGRDVDLRDPIAYTASIDWIRRNVVLKETTEASVLQLHVLSGTASVTLFMQPAGHYVMGSRGKDQIYLVDDPKSEEFKTLLASRIGGTQVTILRGLSSQHGGPQGLGTFLQSSKGDVGTVFRRQDLDLIGRLSTYSQKTENTFEHLRRPLSLLVCMIAESARIPIMQRDFTNMYYGHDVVADEAIQAYSRAKFLLSIAVRAFPLYPPNLAVEKLQKRAAELDSLLTAILSEAKTNERAKVVLAMLNQRNFAGSERVGYQISRFRDMCAELNLKNEPETITRVISTCQNESAVRAAKQGVEGPEITRAFKAHT